MFLYFSKLNFLLTFWKIAVYFFRSRPQDWEPVKIGPAPQHWGNKQKSKIPYISKDKRKKFKFLGGGGF